jgi:hypothetical protein
MFIITQSTKFWYKHTMRLRVLNVSAYCGHHQVQSPFFISAIPSYTGQCLHTRSAFYRYVVYVLSLLYNMLNIKIKIFKTIKIF